MHLPVEGRLGKSLACGQWLAGRGDRAEASEITGLRVWPMQQPELWGTGPRESLT